MSNTWKNGDGSNDSAPLQQSDTEMALTSVGGYASQDQPNAVYLQIGSVSTLHIGPTAIHSQTLSTSGVLGQQVTGQSSVMYDIQQLPNTTASTLASSEEATSYSFPEGVAPKSQIRTANLSESAEKQLETLLQDLQKNLKRRYKRATLPRIPWIHTGQDLPLNDYYADLKSVSSGNVIGLEEIFGTATPLKKTEESEMLQQIFVEGKAGFGKTALVTKLAYDWATNQKYMKNFTLVFVLQLRRIQDVKSALRQQAENCGFKKLEKLEDLIYKNDSKVLILLDRYDEVPPGSARDSICKVLYGTDYNEATVLLTCRNGMFNKNNEEQQALPSISIECRVEFWDRKIEVLGLNELGKKKMLEGFLTTDQSKKLFERFQHLTKEASEILNSPLILTLIGFLYSKGKDVDFNVSNTNLFKDIVNGLLNYNVRKQNESINRNIDLFGNQQEVPESLKKDFVEFGKICMEYLEETKFNSENSDLMERIYSKGFLIKIDSKSIYGTETSFEPIH